MIEVLIAGFAISLLVQLFLAWISASRESARNSVCQNNLRLIGQAIIAHEEARQHYPAGGWGYLWVGDPNRGPGIEQPGGWIYNLLPFAGFDEVHDIGHGLAGDERTKALSEMCRNAVPLFACPSRERADRPIPVSHLNEKPEKYKNYNPLDVVGKSDYAGCAGDLYTKDAEKNVGPGSYALADQGDLDRAPFWIDRSKMTGVFYQASVVRRSDVTDGVSGTYFVGEKYVDPLRYRAAVTTVGDNQNMYVGADSDIVRWTAHFDGTNLPPLQDYENFKHNESFGAVHPSGCNFLFGDGSVETVSYNVDPTIHNVRANRHNTATQSRAN